MQFLKKLNLMKYYLHGIVYYLTLKNKVLFMKEKHQQDLTHIRKMMEGSTKFMSLSGLSGIFIGLYAIIGAVLAYVLVQDHFVAYSGSIRITKDIIKQLFAIPTAVLILSLATAYFLSKRKAKNQQYPFWNKTAKKMAFNMAIPLAFGGVLVLGLIYHKFYLLIPAATLLFYGLALINASHYTLKEIKGLGIVEACLGLLSLFDLGYGIVYWAIGFGFMHIIYGIYIYMKYERQPSTK